MVIHKYCTGILSQLSMNDMDALVKFTLLVLAVMLLILMEIMFIQNESYPRHIKVPIFDRKGHQYSPKLPKQHKGTAPTRVLVVTYMRSGSTLIGDILQRHDNSAYAFEPLRYIEEDIMNNNTVTFLNGTHRLYARNESTLLFADMLYRWFTCDVQKINIRDLQSNMLLYSYSYSYHYYCVRRGIDRFKNSASTQVRIHIIKMCIEHLTRPCRSKKVMIIKTIRLEMASVKLLLKWLPGLKVVHLLRDPRGKLSSELKLDENRWSSIDSIASLHCNRMFSDVVQAYRLNKHYPNTIRILRYERFSNDPIDKTRKMFRFLNLNFTTKILEYVKSTTLNESVRKSCYYCIKRTNAGLASTKWRVDLPHPHVQRIDRQCMKLYRIVGFVAMKDSNSLRNLSIPSQVASLKFMTL